MSRQPLIFSDLLVLHPDQTSTSSTFFSVAVNLPPFCAVGACSIPLNQGKDGHFQYPPPRCASAKPDFYRRRSLNMNHLNSDSGTMTPASSQFSEDKKGEIEAEKEAINRTVSRTPTPARSFLNACVIVLTATSSMIINVSVISIAVLLRNFSDILQCPV